LTLFSPVGRESRRTFRRILPAFAAGLFAGALLTAALLWLLSGLTSPLPPVAARILLVAALALLALRDLEVVRFWLPENHRQIPQSVLRKPGAIPALQFGFELGTGVRTYAPAAAPYMVAVAVILLHPAWWSVVAVAAGFAAGRAMMPATRLLSGDPEAWDELLAKGIRRLTVATAVVTAALLCAGALLGHA